MEKKSPFILKVPEEAPIMVSEAWQYGQETESCHSKMHKGRIERTGHGKEFRFSKSTTVMFSSIMVPCPRGSLTSPNSTNY